ncbi:MAG: PLP-dependent transferase [Ruminococcaceae bacterium]|nr:PLP-dependent transferase [Oscillospiraceae bacterium]
MIDKSKREGLSIDTKVVRGYDGVDPLTGAVSTPIYQTSTFQNTGINSGIKYSYSRCNNPTRDQLGNLIAMLENGVAGFPFTSGLAAVLACFSMLKSGDHVVLSNDIYGGTYRQIAEFFIKYGVKHTFVPIDDNDAVEAAMLPETKMIFAETPTNPMMTVADISKLSEIAKAHKALLVIDNTFLSPYFQRPIELGADIVVHSGTKFLAGHHDTICGFVVVNSSDLEEHFEYITKTQGAALSPMDSWLVTRGIKTLALRMERHQENALKCADFLKNHPKVDKVFYVGLPEHKSYEVSKKQASGFGGMISFTLKSNKNVNEVLTSGKIIMFAESLGGVNSLITYPLTQTHWSIPEEIRNEIGLTDTLLRFSVGIENCEDIIRDLDNMLSFA